MQVSGNPGPGPEVLKVLEQKVCHGLQQAKKITGLPLAVEVATGKQVEDALTFDVDVLWIGARTTVNPFSVQEVADALTRSRCTCADKKSNQS